jgi:glutamyl-Q tRNA(Asp) synthetase
VSAPARYRGRFAPSPTGDLHFGSLITAFASWLRARQAGGEWLVRIEDLDPPREVPGAAQSQLEQLRAFGLESDGPVWRQSERASHYDAALAPLLAAGLAFACRCSRSDLALQAGIHRACVASDESRPAAIRARVPARRIEFRDAVQGQHAQILSEDVGDFVLKRADGLTAYQLAVVVDDAAQGISEIVRGSDLLDSTPRQIWLQQMLGLATPHYVHLPLALDETGQKLSKSLRGLALDAADPLPALHHAWAFLGQMPDALARRGSIAMLQRDAIAHFDLARIRPTARTATVNAPV